ncbi:Imm1 family immunity protein [Kribbella sp. NPDC050459]|uniref:Imm1 family immunity protein n=1 Tax=Kribbella sp. NPDC050459 TaxID=3155785 RepID=UPI0033F0CA38
MSVLEATYDYETLQVNSVDDLSALLDTVASLPLPTWLELATPQGDVLLIGLGADFSSLRFTEARDDGRTYHSSATLDSPQDAEFQFGTVPTAMDTGSALTVTEARAAAAEFLQTARRPERVAWKLVDGHT